METLIPYDTEIHFSPKLIVVPQISNVSKALPPHFSAFPDFVHSSPFSHRLSSGPMRKASTP